MKIEDITTTQLTEIAMCWNIEYEQSYLNAIHNGDIAYISDTTEFEMLRDHEEANRRVQEAITAYNNFIAANAEWFI